MAGYNDRTPEMHADDPASAEMRPQERDAQGEEMRRDKTSLAIPAGIGLYILVVALAILGVMGVGIVIL